MNNIDEIQEEKLLHKSSLEAYGEKLINHTAFCTFFCFKSSFFKISAYISQALSYFNSILISYF